MKCIKYLALALAIFATSCKEAEKPVTKEQAQEFTNAITKSILKKDNSFFNEAIDVEAMLNKVKALSPDQSDRYWKGAKEGFGKKIDFGDRIIEGLGNDGSYMLVKQYQKGDQQHLIFRLFGSGGLNYHDIELCNKKNKAKIADIYIYTTGETLTESMKDIFSQIMNIGEKGNANMEKISAMQRIKKLLSQGKYEQAKEIIDELPFSLKSLKAIQIYNIQICSQISDSLNTDAIDKFQRDYPGDPSLDLVLIDGFLLKKKYDEALACVNRLDKQINTDPFLDYYRGLIYNLMEKKAEAQQSLERLYKTLPSFSQGALELSTYYMDKNEYEKAADIVNKTKQNRDYNKESVQNLYMLYPKLKQYLKD